MVAISKLLAATVTALVLPIATASPIAASPTGLVDGVVIAQRAAATTNNTNNEVTTSENTPNNVPAKRYEYDVVPKHWDDWPEHQKALALGTWVDDFNLRMPRVDIHYKTTIEEWQAMAVLLEMQQFLDLQDWQSFYEWTQDGAKYRTFTNAVECRMDRAGLFKLQKVPWNCDEFCKKWDVCGGK